GGSNPGSRPREVSHRARIARTAARTDRCDVLAEDQEVGAWMRGYRNTDGDEDSRQYGIEEETRKLRVVLRLIHAEAVFGTSPDDELVDEGVTHALHLPEGTEIFLRIWWPAHGYAMARGSGIGADHRLLVSSPVNLAIVSKLIAVH